MLIRALAKIPYFRRKIIEEAFSLKTKSRDRRFASLKFMFKDKEGRNWYTFASEMDIYVKRKLAIDAKMIELSAQLSRTELNDIIKAMKLAINQKTPDLQTLGHLIYEMEKRQDMLLHYDIMYDLLALHYVREDELPDEVDSDIHEQKVALLKHERSVNFFLQCQSLNDMLPFLADFGESMKELLNDSEVEVKALKMWVDQYISQHASTSNKSNSNN